MKVLVTNCTRNSGLAVMRTLAGAGWQVIGADDRIFALGLRSRCVAEPYELLPPEDDPRFTDALLGTLKRIRPDVLIPTRGIEAACRVRETVNQVTKCLLPSPESFDVLNDKAKLLQQCAAFRIAAPRVFEPEEAVEFLRTGARGSQIVIKPCRDLSGGRGVHMVADADAVHSTCGSISAQYGPALITDYIPGPVDNLRAVHLLFDSASRLIAFFVMRKLRIWPAGVGVTVAALSTHETGLLNGLVPFLRGLKWQGPADAEFKIDARDGVARILEINPRFSGAVQFPIASGVDMAQLYCRAALGERLPEITAAAYPAGMHYIDTTRWVAAAFAALGARDGSRAQWLRACRNELRQPRVGAVNRISDPRPILGKLLPMRHYD